MLLLSETRFRSHVSCTFNEASVSWWILPWEVQSLGGVDGPQTLHVTWAFFQSLFGRQYIIMPLDAREPCLDGRHPSGAFHSKLQSER